MNKLIRLGSNGNLSVDGQPNKPAVVSRAGLAILVIDRSGSMSGSKTTQASAGAWDFSQAALRNGYRVATIAFASSALVTCPPSQQPEELRRGCFVNSGSGSTAMHEGLKLAMSLGPVAGDMVVVVTDGVADDPDAALALAAQLRAWGVEILAIGTDDADRSFLSRLASRPDLGVKVAPNLLRQTISQASRLLRAPRS